MGSNEITGVSINKASNQSVYIQWADVNPTIPQYRVVLWYNGSQRLDTILSGQDAANDYYIWYVDMGTYALMPGDVIKATVTPYAGGQPQGPSYSATATIQDTPQAQEPTAVQQVTPVSQPPVVATPTSQPPTPTPVQQVTPVVTNINYAFAGNDAIITATITNGIDADFNLLVNGTALVSQIPLSALQSGIHIQNVVPGSTYIVQIQDARTGTQLASRQFTVPATVTPMFSAVSWIKSHVILSAGIVIGAGFAIRGARKQ